MQNESQNTFSDSVKSLKEANITNLLIALEINKAHRNAALLFAIISAILIYWQSWRLWTFLFPGVLILYAALRHANIIIMNSELKRRISEKQSSDNPTANNKI